MAVEIPTRAEAWQLLCEYNDSEVLRRHALAVEGVMRRFARQRGADEELWGIVGLLHDLDYERYPDEHCRQTERILRAHDYPEHLIHAVLSHGWGGCTSIEPEGDMECVLYAIDELTGLVAATALVRPNKSIYDTSVKSVMKKWKNARFAAGVNRRVIAAGAERLGLDLAELIADVIAGMQEVAAAIGLDGASAETAG
jgi:predicted hydrolase (HD superfamily)